MRDSKDVEPAFPFTETIVADTNGDGALYKVGTKEHVGLSIRDWFAGQMASVTVARAAQVSSVEELTKYLAGTAELAYRFADTMLAERSKGTS